MTKPLHAGMAAMSGVQAAKLAALGWDASPSALEAPLGFAAAFSGTEAPQITAVAAHGQDDWAILAPASLVLKRFPACAATHPAIRAAIAVHRELGEEVHHLEHAEVHVSEAVLGILRQDPPRTGNEARFSLEYTVACGLLHGQVALSDFEETAPRRPELVELMQKIRVLRPKHSSYDFGASVAVQLADGRICSHTAPDNTEDTDDGPAQDEAVREKFMGCVGNSRRAQELWQTMRFGSDELPASAIVAATSRIAETREVLT
jgi:2-methylcitrate dehydratase PrpD